MPQSRSGDRRGRVGHLESRRLRLARAATLRVEEFHLDTDQAGPLTWLLVRANALAEAAAIAASVKGNERLRIGRKIDRALSPHSATQALEDYATSLIGGKDDEAKRALADLKKMISSQ